MAGFGKVTWPRTAQGSTASVQCPADNQETVASFGSRRCVGRLGSPVWAVPGLSLCPLSDATAQMVASLTSSLLQRDVSSGITQSTNSTVSYLLDSSAQDKRNESEPDSGEV